MNNPFKPVPQRRDRYDETYHRRRDPVAYYVTKELHRRGF